MYKDKYLKYKNKYLDCKKGRSNLKGGSSAEGSRETQVGLKTQLEREATFQQKFANLSDTSSYSATDEEIEAQFNELRAFEPNVSEERVRAHYPRYMLINMIKEAKRTAELEKIKRDPDYLQSLTCQILSTSKLSEEPDTTQKQLLQRVLVEDGWFVANARGDGRCMVHSIIHGIRDILGINTVEINEPFELIVFKALREYFTRTNTSKIDFEIRFKKGNVVVNSSDTDEILKRKIETILNQNEIDNALFKVLGVYFNINILELTNTNDQFTYQHVLDLRSDNCIIIMIYSGHYKLIYNQNKNITKQKIEEILKNRQTDATGYTKNIQEEGIYSIVGFWYVSEEKRKDMKSKPLPVDVDVPGAGAGAGKSGAGKSGAGEGKGASLTELQESEIRKIIEEFETVTEMLRDPKLGTNQEIIENYNGIVTRVTEDEILDPTVKEYYKKFKKKDQLFRNELTTLFTEVGHIYINNICLSNPKSDACYQYLKTRDTSRVGSDSDSDDDFGSSNSNWGPGPRSSSNWGRGIGEGFGSSNSNWGDEESVFGSGARGARRQGRQGRTEPLDIELRLEELAQERANLEETKLYHDRDYRETKMAIMKDLERLESDYADFNEYYSQHKTSFDSEYKRLSLEIEKQKAMEQKQSSAPSSGKASSFGQSFGQSFGKASAQSFEQSFGKASASSFGQPLEEDIPDVGEIAKINEKYRKELDYAVNQLKAGNIPASKSDFKLFIREYMNGEISSSDKLMDLVGKIRKEYQNI